MPILEGEGVVGHPRPGMGLRLEYEYVGGEPGDITVTWTTRKGAGVKNVTSKAKALPGCASEYMVQNEDEGRQIAVEIEPVRADGMRGESITLFSRPVSSSCCFSG
jgi:hypothetical protein